MTSMQTPHKILTQQNNQDQNQQQNTKMGPHTSFIQKSSHTINKHQAKIKVQQHEAKQDTINNHGATSANDNEEKRSHIISQEIKEELYHTTSKPTQKQQPHH